MKRYNLTDITKTLCELLDIAPPEYAKTDIPELLQFAKEKTGRQAVDRMVIFNPDAVGEWLVHKYPKIFEEFLKKVQLTLEMRSQIPPKTPVCFGSIYTGAQPREHGIEHYEKKKIVIESFFDSLANAGKKACIVTVQNQSMDILFRDRGIDYFPLKNDKAVVQKALQLIEEKTYDVIVVYNQEYDDIMHRTHPKSMLAKAALKHYMASAIKLMEAVKTNYVGEKTLFATITDHGVHREWYGLGSHGKNIDKDMNILHFYSLIE